MHIDAWKDIRIDNEPYHLSHVGIEVDKYGKKQPAR
jgi:hypothetical protein